MKELIYVTEPGAINLQALRDVLPAHYEVIEGDTSFIYNAPEEITTILIRSVTKVTTDIKRVFPNLIAVIRVGTGLDNIDLEFCREAGIQVYNSPGANADAVSDYVVCTMLMALRRTHLITSEDLAEWNRFKFVGHSLSAQTVGIVGFGHIGRQLYGKLKGFGCRFVVYDPFISRSSMPEDVEYVSDIDDLLKKCTVVSLHVPLLEETKDLISGKNLHLMPCDSVLINASRGGIVNEKDIVEVARTKNLTYVADTVIGEPHVNEVLLDNPHVVITPHIGSLTEESDLAMLTIAVDNFLSLRPVRSSQGMAHAVRAI